MVDKLLDNTSRHQQLKKGLCLAGLGLITWLLAACGYPTPPGGGGLTPFVVVVTPTSLPQTNTSAATLTNTTANPTATAAAALILATIPPNTIAPTPKLTPTLSVVGNEYTVQAGDTLFGICKRLGVDYEDMVDLNKIEDPNKLKIGQVLKIPSRPSGVGDPTTTPKS